LRIEKDTKKNPKPKMRAGVWESTMFWHYDELQTLNESWILGAGVFP